MSRQDSIRLQTESDGEPQTCPSTPLLAWMNPVTRPAQPVLLVPPDSPVPWAPTWIAIWDGNPWPSEMAFFASVLDPDVAVPTAEAVQGPPVR